MVAVGFKAKWSASFLVTLLSVFNVFINNWCAQVSKQSVDTDLLLGGACILLILSEISSNTICESLDRKLEGLANSRSQLPDPM